MIGFTTRLRTWLLIAALSALLVAIGFLLGGSYIYLFLGLAVVMNFFGYFFSDKVALASSRAQPIEESQAPELYADIRELTKRAGLPMPRIYMTPSEQPNAFATGRNPKHSAVAVTQGLVQLMPREQVKGVLAHELSHVKNHDILVSSIAAMIGTVITWVSYMFLFFGGDNENSSPFGALGGIAALIVGPLAATLLQLGISRQREYLADASGAKLLGQAAPLADALESLERASQRNPDAGEPGNRVAVHHEPADHPGHVEALLDPPADRGACSTPARDGRGRYRLEISRETVSGDSFARGVRPSSLRPNHRHAPHIGGCAVPRFQT